MPHYGIGKLIFQRMPRILQKYQTPKSTSIIIPPHLVSYQTIIQTAAATPTRTCETTKLITKGKAPLYSDYNLNLTHKNTVANDHMCLYVPDFSLHTIGNRIAIKWPFLTVLRNLTTCISQLNKCQQVLIREPNCTNIEWIQLLPSTNILEVLKPATITMQCNKETVVKHMDKISAFILQELCDYTIAPRDSTQILQIRKLELINSQIEDDHMRKNLMDIRFLLTKKPELNNTGSSQLLSPSTHQALTIFNIALPTIIILLGLLLAYISYKVGKTVNRVSLLFIHHNH